MVATVEPSPLGDLKDYLAVLVDYLFDIPSLRAQSLARQMREDITFPSLPATVLQAGSPAARDLLGCLAHISAWSDTLTPARRATLLDIIRTAVVAGCHSAAEQDNVKGRLRSGYLAKVSRVCCMECVQAWNGIIAAQEEAHIRGRHALADTDDEGWLTSLIEQGFDGWRVQIDWTPADMYTFESDSWSDPIKRAHRDLIREEMSDQVCDLCGERFDGWSQAHGEFTAVAGFPPTGGVAADDIEGVNAHGYTIDSRVSFGRPLEPKLDTP